MNPHVQSEPPPRSVGTARRDRYLLAVTAVTGLATAGAMTATGWIAGQAANAWAQQSPAPAPSSPQVPATQLLGTQPAGTQAAGTKHRAGARKPRVVVRTRPTRTRVSTRYVTSPAPVGGGGSV